jgi:sterol desaturase/sphingolipid hydroxylase (fatty acid hydroxylase superfamily)
MLSNIQPVMIFVLLGFFFTLETYIPYLTQYRNRRKHTLRNLVLVLISFTVNGLAASWLTYWLSVIHERGWGLLNLLNIGLVPSVILGVLYIDLDSYVGHIVLHKVPLLWRVHRIHHSDNELDSTTSLRFHPFETLFSALWRTVTFSLFGVSFASFVIFFTINLPLLFIQHANIRFPGFVEKWLSLFIVTSTWHKVHHSDEPEYTDSHFGSVFTFWDRIFGTWHRNVAIDKLKWGLKELKADKDQRIDSQLLLPFRRVGKVTRQAEEPQGNQAIISQ